MELTISMLVMVVIHLIPAPKLCVAQSALPKVFTCEKEQYLIVEEKHTWLDAPAVCHTHGMLLASVRESIHEIPCVRKAGARDNRDALWVAAYKSSRDGPVRDTAGRQLSLTSKDIQNSVGCIAVNSTGQFGSYSCSQPHRVLCQKGPCLPTGNHIQASGSCYYPLDKKDKTDLETALKICISYLPFHPNKGQLLQLETHQEATAFYNRRVPVGQGAWLGGHRWIVGGRKKFHWIVGLGLVDTDFWAPHQPSSSFDCMRTGKSTKSVSTINCRSKQNVICELVLCPSGWTFILDYCMKLFETAVTHPAATTLCHTQGLPGTEGSHLLSIESEAKFLAVEEHFLNHTNKNIWLGLNLTGARNEYRWDESGRRLKNTDYTNWAPNEPNGQIHGERCVEIGTKYNDGLGEWLWNDVGCHHLRYVICQQNTLLAASETGLHSNTTCPPAPAPPANSYRKEAFPGTHVYRCDDGYAFDGNIKEISLNCVNGLWNASALELVQDSVCKVACRDGWIKYGSHCYSASVGVHWMNFTNAAHVCKRQGAYLVEVHDSKEAQFVARLAASNNMPSFYIGLSDRHLESYFIWEHSRLDVRAQGFNLWPHGVYPKTPSDKYHEENDCVVSTSKSWDPLPCNKAYPFICERELEVETCQWNRTISTSHPFKQLTYDQAAAECIQHYSHLPVLTSSSIDKCLKTNNTVPKNVPTENQVQWLALRKERNGYFWRSSQTAIPLDKSKAKWATGQPVAAAGDCVVSDNTGYWHSASCTELHFFQCEHESLQPTCPPLPPTPLAAGRTVTYARNSDTIIRVTYTCWESFQFQGVYGLSGNKNRTSITLECIHGVWNGSVPKECTDVVCSPGYHIFNDQCYKLHDEVAIKHDASATCVNEGAELVTVTSQRQETYLAHFIGSTANGRNGAWIKLNDERKEGVFRWGTAPNSPLLSRGSYIDWGLGQPDNAGLQGEHCVELRGGGWNDVTCLAKRRYVCAYGSSQTDLQYCPDPDYPLHGKRTSATDRFYQSDTVEFSCFPGYELQPKNAILTCVRHGRKHKWDKSLPTCVVKSDECDPSAHGCSPNATCYLSRHHGVTCVCKYGFEGNGQICKVKSCPALPVPAHGSWSTNATNVFTVAKLRCSSGYHVADSSSDEASCLFGGVWDVSTPQCIKTDTCEDIGYQCSDNTACVFINGKPKCVCITGYTINDDGEVKCRAPTCRALPPQANGNITVSDYGFSIVSCNEGYKLYNYSAHNDYARQYVTCQVKDGRAQWDELPHACVDINECTDVFQCPEMCINTPGSYMCVGDDHKPTVTNCTIDVGSVSLSKGFVDYNSIANETGDFYFGCEYGYYLEGSPIMSCAQFINNPDMKPRCVDVDECTDRYRPCEDAACINTPGSYMCECVMPISRDSFDPCYVYPRDYDKYFDTVRKVTEKKDKRSFYGLMIGVPVLAFIIVAIVIWRARVAVVAAGAGGPPGMSRLATSSTESLDAVSINGERGHDGEEGDDDDDVALLQ